MLLCCRHVTSSASLLFITAVVVGMRCLQSYFQRYACYSRHRHRHVTSSALTHHSPNPNPFMRHFFAIFDCQGWVVQGRVSVTLLRRVASWLINSSRKPIFGLIIVVWRRFNRLWHFGRWSPSTLKLNRDLIFNMFSSLTDFLYLWAEVICVFWSLFYKNGPSWPLFHLFSSCQTNITKNVKNVQCWDSNPWPSEHDYRLITTRPGLPQIYF